MPHLVISTSLNPASKSYVLAREAFQQLSDGGHEVEFLDLRKVKLPFCDGADCYSKPSVARVRAKIEKATTIIVAVPIYNYDCGAAAKNLVELTGRAWTDKTVGFLCAAGGRSSYMSVMAFANSLMLDFRCLVIPRFVYAEGSAFTADTISDETIVERVGEFVARAVLLDGANISLKP
jgi:NAD(P)H-dependent FMN reductase